MKTIDIRRASSRPADKGPREGSIADCGNPMPGVRPSPPLEGGSMVDVSTPAVREATADDAEAIHQLITDNLQSGHLLPRSLADVTARASRFVVVAGPSGVLACGELAPLNASVAEVRSLVVREDSRGMTLGRTVVDELRRRARAGRYRTLCAFTHDPRFFVRMGFSIVPHTWLPEKVAADCWSCQHFQQCGQYAVVDSRVGMQAVSRREIQS